MNKECQIKYGCYFTNNVALNAIITLLIGGGIGALIAMIWTTGFLDLF